MTNSWQPVSSVAKTVYELGFVYQPEQDIIVSRLDALQRKLGFTWAYDVLSPALRMIIDCEPIYFTYGGKNWMIELWKGQYGLETGAEIGVYNAAANPPTVRQITDTIRSWFPGIAEVADHAQETVAFFASASPAEQLVMSFTLSKDGNPLFTRGPESHWWLTGFKWGEFTKSTSQLTMAIEIVFPNAAMCNAFESALRAMAYSGIANKDARTIAFTFSTPKTTQPKSRTVGEASQQALNAELVRQYVALRESVASKAELEHPINDPNLFDEKALSSVSSYQKVAAFFELLQQGQSRMKTIWQQH